MRRVKVKICGITREEDLKLVSALGADVVGFLVGVPSSPRNLSLKKAEKLIKLVPIFVKSVLVTVPRSVGEVLKIYERTKPDVIQIHGENFLNISVLREKLPNTPLIKAVNANSPDAFETALEMSKLSSAILLDSSVKGRYGGTGVTHDWKLSKLVKQAIHPKPLILAGGLTPKNVKEAVRTVQPYAVDVCTGVESRLGVKDPEKVSSFIENAKEIKIYDD